MTVKTITYKRILNLGNYESKHLEMTIEVGLYLGLAEEECSQLMETVERKIREDTANKIEQELADAQKLLREVKAEYEDIKDLIKEALHPTPDHPDFDNDDTEENESDF